MFEKEAEEIANKRCHEIMCFGHCSFSSPKHHRCGEWHREYNCAKEGIEYGYNKANEWHYVKDEKDLPTDRKEYLLLLGDSIRTFGFYNGRFWESWKGDFSWQEVKAYFFVPVPELPKESE